MAYQAQRDNREAFNAARRVDHHINPPQNDPGAMRGVTDHNQRVIGAMAHPENNTGAFTREYLEPLDREGREHLARFEDEYNVSRREAKLATKINQVLALYSIYRYSIICFAVTLAFKFQL